MYVHVYVFYLFVNGHYRHKSSGPLRRASCSSLAPAASTCGCVYVYSYIFNVCIYMYVYIYVFYLLLNGHYRHKSSLHLCGERLALFEHLRISELSYARSFNQQSRVCRQLSFVIRVLKYHASMNVSRGVLKNHEPIIFYSGSLTISRM